MTIAPVEWRPPCPECGEAFLIVPLVNGRLLCLPCDKSFEWSIDAPD